MKKDPHIEHLRQVIENIINTNGEEALKDPFIKKGIDLINLFNKKQELEQAILYDKLKEEDINFSLYMNQAKKLIEDVRNNLWRYE